MSKTQAIKAIRAMGFSAKSLPETGEIKIARPGETYFTNCAKDAYDTAKLWKEQTTKRLEYLSGEIKAERISYGELAELQALAKFIPSGDVELLEAAGVPEHKES